MRSRRPISAQLRVSYENITPSIQNFTSWFASFWQFFLTSSTHLLFQIKWNLHIYWDVLLFAVMENILQQLDLLGKLFRNFIFHIRPKIDLFELIVTRDQYIRNRQFCRFWWHPVHANCSPEAPIGLNFNPALANPGSSWLSPYQAPFKI